jgi:hypothetical protein
MSGEPINMGNQPVYIIEMDGRFPLPQKPSSKKGPEPVGQRMWVAVDIATGQVTDWGIPVPGLTKEMGTLGQVTTIAS